MKTYVLPVIYTVSGHILVRAESAEDACKLANAKNIGIADIEDPDHACEILKDGVETIEA